MSGIGAGAKAALSYDPQRFARFVTITFPDYTFRVWTGVGTRTVNDNVYIGAGHLGSIAPISDKSDLSAQRIQLSLSGLDPSLSAEVQNYLIQGCPVEIIEAQLDADENIIDGTYSIFFGQIDVPSETFGPTYTITLQVDNFLSFMFRGPDGRRATGNDQEQLFPNSGSPDLGFMFVANLLTNIPWGQNSSVTASVGGTSSGSQAATRQIVTK